VSGAETLGAARVSERSVGLLGLGHALPARVRSNDDPVFAALRRGDDAESQFFRGTRERRALGPGEDVEGLMIEASRRALDDAGLRAEDIDRLYGYAFVSRFLTPNGLYRVHRELGLRTDAMVVPVNTEFSNFITATTLAWEAIAAGRARHVLVVCGAAMTPYMDYASPHAIAIGDGAGAAVVGPGDKLVIVDALSRTLSAAFDVMNMRPRAVLRDGARWARLDDDGIALPIYEMGEAGLETVMREGAEVPPEMVRELLARHGVEASRVGFLGHQPARALMEHWQRVTGVGEYWDTYESVGNATLASVPITLSMRRSEMRADHLVLVSPGTGTHFAALLLRC
jgi:3-oxoacyl-[acyl-carrier-protein] synthase III